MEVLKNPLRFAKIKGRNMLDDPLAIPGKTLSYARYDVVRVLNSLMEALRLDQSSFEPLIARGRAAPAPVCVGGAARGGGGGAGEPLHALAPRELPRRAGRRQRRGPPRAR